jgi:hypothetical protein
LSTGERLICSYSDDAVRTLKLGYEDFQKITINTVGKSEDDIVKAVVSIAKGGDDLLSFVNKTLNQKLDEIVTIWKTKYPVEEMFEGRVLFEDIMGYYRYTKSSGWAHTADIADNFKGVDFYKDFTVVGDRIYAEIAVSMKTTITKDVNAWLSSAPIKKNIEFLKEGLGDGFVSNGKTMKITEKAKIDIYMPKENITDELLQTWQKRLVEITKTEKIEFEIKALEDFIN